MYYVIREHMASECVYMYTISMYLRKYKHVCKCVCVCMLKPPF